VTLAICERDKRPGVLYAYTDGGVELPIIDVTNPAFAVEIDQAQLPRFTEEQVKSMERWLRAPAFLRAWFARNSVLMSSNQSGVLDGMTTYLYKLGPDNLGAGYTKRMDRRVAANIMAVAVRLRFREVVRMMSEDLSSKLSRTQGPVHLLNLAGGTSMDSLNALIAVRKKSPEALSARRMHIHVLDPDATSFAFAAAALTALTDEPAAPLHGVDVIITHERYDWADPSTLSTALRKVAPGPEEPTIVGSSEGGLFEYGSDEQIVGNLEALRETAPADLLVAGSALKEEPITRLMKKMSRTSFVPRTLDDLTAVVARAGWKLVEAVEANPVYHVVTVGKVRS
jgi:hypothetical protein